MIATNYPHIAVWALRLGIIGPWTSGAGPKMRPDLNQQPKKTYNNLLFDPINKTRLKSPYPVKNPELGSFERVLGLACLWSSGAIVVGCPFWQYQWPWWDLNHRPIDREPQASSTEPRLPTTFDPIKGFEFFSIFWFQLIVIFSHYKNIIHCCDPKRSVLQTIHKL